MTTRKICVGMLTTLLAWIGGGGLVEAQPQPLSFKVGDSQASGTRLLVQLGSVAVGDIRQFKVEIAKPAATALRIRAFCEGKWVTCSWDGASRSDRADSNRPVETLKVAFEASEEARTLQYILVTDDRGATLAFIGLNYQLFVKKQVDLNFVTPPYVSGDGTAFGPWYTVCSGPVTEGYQLVGEEFTASGEETRACGRWLNCEKLQSDQTNVCYRFQIQGKEEQAGKNPREIKKGSANLKVTWRLVESSPRIEAVPEK